ncbi:MAG TPA: hypothetical protein VEX15_12830 [Nocardioidaceae bacterium]|nr:hypothetical protein [Nocardioidaceae bacterium]
MAVRYYRMSTGPKAVAVVRTLAENANVSVSRLLGYAHRSVLRFDHPDDYDLDLVIRDVDPMARAVPEPPSGMVVTP